MAGEADAIPGLYMRGHPEPGTSDYSLVYAPNAGDPPGSDPVDDRGRIIDNDVDGVCVAIGCFDDVLVVEEQNILAEGDCCQINYHAPGVGVIKAEPSVVVPGEAFEFLELAEVRRLSKEELAAVSAQVLEMDQRAYTEATAAPLWENTREAHRVRGREWSKSAIRELLDLLVH